MFAQTTRRALGFGPTAEAGNQTCGGVWVAVASAAVAESGAVEVDGPVGPVMRVPARPSPPAARDHAVVGPVGEASRVSLPVDVRAGDLPAVPCAGDRPLAPLFAVVGGERRLLPRATAAER